MVDLRESPIYIFTPNDDRKKDLFEIKVTGVDDGGSYGIFSRWGVQVVESASLHATWDGKAASGGSKYHVALVGEKVYRGRVELVK